MNLRLNNQRKLNLDIIGGEPISFITHKEIGSEPISFIAPMSALH